ncbi:MAG: hypothetical protein ACJA1T_000496 [Zhongshania aliphaticivorans]|jgi:hypothetical protein
MKNAIFFVLFFSFLQVSYADDYHVWGSYNAGDWEWKVVIIPENTSGDQLLKIARTLSVKYPSTRIRFFNDEALVKQFVDRDRYLYDTTGLVPEVEYPTEWVKAHHIANINDRSNNAWRRWQLVSVYGDNIAFLE